MSEAAFTCTACDRGLAKLRLLELSHLKISFLFGTGALSCAQRTTWRATKRTGAPQSTWLTRTSCADTASGSRRAAKRHAAQRRPIARLPGPRARDFGPRPRKVLLRIVDQDRCLIARSRRPVLLRQIADVMIALQRSLAL